MNTLPPCAYTFPDPLEADPEGYGLICVGGDLAPSTLVQAYAQGLFPWFSQGEPIRWWSPEPRCVFYPAEYAPQKSLVRSSKKSTFLITLNADFSSVITACASTLRGKQPSIDANEELELGSQAHASTWITEDMIAAYNELHRLGFAHSIEVWQPQVANRPAQVSQHTHTLVGGLYGLKLGAGFFGESMFHTQTDASKYAFWFLAKLCLHTGLDFIDGQLSNPHLHRLGAVDIPRPQFLTQLSDTVAKPRKHWQAIATLTQPYLVTQLSQPPLSQLA